MTVDAFLQQQQQQDLLRFITCGSVDDGKSTLAFEATLVWMSEDAGLIGRSYDLKRANAPTCWTATTCARG